MPKINPDVVASRLRGNADKIAARMDRPTPASDLIEVIKWVRDLSWRASKELRIALKSDYPAIGWVGEEERPESSGGLYWIHDAIDGAYHFLQRLPLWSSSLALVRDGHAIFGLVYDPSSQELFAALEGLGATLNGKAIAVSHKSCLSTAVVATAIPPIFQAGDREHARSVNLLRAVAPQVFASRQMASASLQLAYVAAGRLDGYWEVGEDTPDWLAGSLLLREAGATVTDLAGDAFGWNCDGILAAPRPVYDQLLKIIRSDRL